MSKLELIDDSEDIRLCSTCKFIHTGYDETLCYRDQKFKIDAVTGYRAFVGKKYDCSTERQQNPNIVVRLYRKITGHVACGIEGKFWNNAWISKYKGIK